jgi:hypothetical protein
MTDDEHAVEVLRPFILGELQARAGDRIVVAGRDLRAPQRGGLVRLLPSEPADTRRSLEA